MTMTNGYNATTSNFFPSKKIKKWLIKAPFDNFLIFFIPQSL